jgi:SNF2 family DNA or RNA helicase
MAKFKRGDQVILSDSKEKGVIIEVCPPQRGRQLYNVIINKSPKLLLETNLIPNLDLTDPFERLKQGLYGYHSDFSRINTSFKIDNTSNNTISSLKASNTIFKAYQFKPLLKFLNSDNRRLLIADEVGLGKTIEAGHIMLELMARKELYNCLIICPNSLKDKWKEELKEKFNFSFKIYDTDDLISDINDRNGPIRAIVNYEKVRLSSKTKKRDLISILEESNTNFDFILCDEAHRLRNKNTQSYKAVEKIINKADSVVLMTATPIMISQENLFNLLRLLDEEEYSEYSIFENELKINKPFIKALNMLNSGDSFQKIKKILTDTEVTLVQKTGQKHLVESIQKVSILSLYNDIPLYKKIISQLDMEDSVKRRVDLQFDISDINKMNKIFSRTRKREVTQDWTQAIRRPYQNLICLYSDERDEFDNVITEYIDENIEIDAYGNEINYPGTTLGLITKKRQISSSVYAYLNKDEDLDKGIDRFSDKEDAKIDALIQILNQVVKQEKRKLIIFAIFVKTLKYLQIRLKNLGYNTAIIYGKDNNRSEEINKFKTDNNIDILLSSEVGSEGLDLQFCDAIINYDLPWNPMKIEQRIGRVDRFGQQSPRVHIYNFIVKDSIQEQIYTILLDRIGIFKESIGDLEAILDSESDQLGNKKIRETFSSYERELYTRELTENEKKNKLVSIERAILTENKNLKQISEGLTDSLTSDVYFRNEIGNIENNFKYVTDIELVNYVELLVKMKLTTCQFECINKEELIFRFSIPKSTPRVLVNFINEFIPEDYDLQKSFKDFKNLILDLTCIQVTFSQKAGYENSSLIRINPYHPLIIAAKKYFDTLNLENNNAFQFEICKSRLKSNSISIGEYVLAVYKSVSIKTWFDREQKKELLLPILYDCNLGKVIADKEISEHILGIAQLNAEGVNSDIRIDSSMISNLKYDLTEEILKSEQALKEEDQMRIETHKKMQIQRVISYYDNKIEAQEKILAESEFKIQFENDDKIISNTKKILPVQRKRLQELLSIKENKINKFEASSVSYFSPELLSLSHIRIY